MKDLDQVADAYMQESESDFIALPQIASAVRKELGARTTEEVRELSLEVVKRLYEKGLRAGDYWGGPFDYWPDEGCQAMVDRIAREWIAAGHDPNLGHPICWFAPLRQ